MVRETDWWWWRVPHWGNGNTRHYYTLYSNITTTTTSSLQDQTLPPASEVTRADCHCWLSFTAGQSKVASFLPSFYQQFAWLSSDTWPGLALHCLLINVFSGAFGVKEWRNKEHNTSIACHHFCPSLTIRLKTSVAELKPVNDPVKLTRCIFHEWIGYWRGREAGSQEKRSIYSLS